MRLTSLVPRPVAAAFAAAALTVAAGAAFAAASFIETAISDPGRPAADTERDAARKPADMLAFSGVKPGDTVVELLPGGGYFTRLFSKAVGPAGHLYAAVPPTAPADDSQVKPVTDLAALPAYNNVTVVKIGGGMLVPGGADVLWTSQNYHDLYLTRVHLDTAQFDKLLFNAVKPGGVLIVVDHAAAAGAPVVATADALHRIDPDAARKALEAAGFVYEGESTVLRNPADDHSKNVFDPAIRGHTDQFVYKFRHPK
jgi:predicted methyltransferase